mmetsp:Transcript_95362/g.199508  ORF Transcript_95362/g.199508 Transcript_95362/m.199508 type:complete len:339 (-) Transcript_95362:79-1095(-)
MSCRPSLAYLLLLVSSLHQQLVEAGEVAVTSAVHAHHAVKLECQGSHGESELLLGSMGSTSGKSQILDHQITAEATSVIPARRGSLHNSRAWVADFAGPGSASAGVHNLSELLLIESESIRERVALADAGHLDAEHEVVAKLRGGAGANFAAVNGLLAHELEDMLGALEGFVRSSDHEGESGILGSHGPAGDWCVDHVATLLGACFSDRFGGGRVDSGAVDEEIAGFGVGDETVGGEVDASHGRQRGKHGNDHSGFLRNICLGCSGLGSRFSDRLQHALVQIENNHFPAGLHQVLGHVATHVSESQKSNFARLSRRTEATASHKEDRGGADESEGLHV